MRRILICTGILGGGTALTFAVAALAAAILPGGTVVQSNPVFMERDLAKPGIDFPVPEPMPPGIFLDDGSGGIMPDGSLRRPPRI